MSIVIEPVAVTMLKALLTVHVELRLAWTHVARLMTRLCLLCASAGGKSSRAYSAISMHIKTAGLFEFHKPVDKGQIRSELNRTGLNVSDVLFDKNPWIVFSDHVQCQSCQN